MSAKFINVLRPVVWIEGSEPENERTRAGIEVSVRLNVSLNDVAEQV